ncbi:hypothetical protein GCM10009116_20420 [Brevundimonas basaltis]|uniref:DUF885 domain-containing protein n=1 Tax=Brevundimonas basaltis TaxID=472166 RepID=A0A7W8MH25_9CAUL|nr:hypothetical protein [Brevundimonas basaltis]MBB5291792.1 hypothetical protein [Brevundimonas basaltis]
MRAVVLALLLLVGACATPMAPAAPAAASGDSLDAIARDYVALILEIGEHEDGYVDAYYGPPEWAAAAKANPRSVPQLIQGAATLTDRLNAVSTARADPALAQRKAYLLAHVSAAAARLRMLSGEKMSFADEAEALFGVRPELRPLSAYDPILAEIDALLPGPGSLADRVTEFKSHYVIPKDRLQVVMDAAIAECRRRTARHIALPANENFTLAFVGDKPWSGYNYYQGNSQSKIEINADFPIYTERAIDLGCHEGYPGHHVYNALLEKTFVTDRGWVEMSVYPLFSPMSFVAEGSANYGIDLAFPGDEGTDFERDVLFPLAGLDPATAEKKAQLQALTRQLARAEYTIADAYLAGHIDRDTAIEQLMRYSLADRAKATQRLRFIDTYRSYIINYGLGRDVVQAWVERQGPNRWAAMETLLSSQILPADID